MQDFAHFGSQHCQII